MKSQNSCNLWLSHYQYMKAPNIQRMNSFLLENLLHLNLRNIMKMYFSNLKKNVFRHI